MMCLMEKILKLPLFGTILFKVQIASDQLKVWKSYQVMTKNNSNIGNVSYLSLGIKGVNLLNSYFYQLMSFELAKLN